jgi:hypothetical protein
VLRLEAKAKRLLELKRGRSDAAPGKAHEKARGDYHAFADRGNAARGDVAAVQINFAVEIRRHVELAVGGNRRRKAP